MTLLHTYQREMQLVILIAIAYTSRKIDRTDQIKPAIRFPSASANATDSGQPFTPPC